MVRFDIGSGHKHCLALVSLALLPMAQSAPAHGGCLRTCEEDISALRPRRFVGGMDQLHTGTRDLRLSPQTEGSMIDRSKTRKSCSDYHAT